MPTLKMKKPIRNKILVSYKLTDCISSFCSPHCKHAVTGSLSQNKKLRTILSVGPSYYDYTMINYYKYKQVVKKGVTSKIESSSCKHRLDKKHCLPTGFMLI